MNKLTLKYILLVFLNSLLLGHLSPAASPDYTAAYTSVKDFGATGNGTTDDTAAINAAIIYCENNPPSPGGGVTYAYKTLYFPNGTYKVSSTLQPLNVSYNVVSVVGESPYQTIINGSAITGTNAPVFLTSENASTPNQSGAEIRDIGITGNGSQIGIENEGLEGLKIRNCIFNSLATGIEFSNNINGLTSTQYSVAESCTFNSGCLTAVQFVKGNGNAYFPGCGLKGCTITSTTNTPAIVVGNPGETVNLYNAPLDFQIWVTTPQTIVSIPSTASNVFTHGTITVENDCPTVSGVQPQPTVASGGILSHAGGVTSWSSIIYGTLHLENALKMLSNQSIVEDRKPYRVQTTLTASTTAISGVVASPYGTLVSVTLEGSGVTYDYRYLLDLVANGFGSAGVATVLATPVANNGSGWGAPTFSVDSSGVLHIANSHYAGQSVTMTAAAIPSACPDSWNMMEY